MKKDNILKYINTQFKLKLIKVVDKNMSMVYLK